MVVKPGTFFEDIGKCSQRQSVPGIKTHPSFCHSVEDPPRKQSAFFCWIALLAKRQNKQELCEMNQGASRNPTFRNADVLKCAFLGDLHLQHSIYIDVSVYI